MPPNTLWLQMTKHDLLSHFSTIYKFRTNKLAKNSQTKNITYQQMATYSGKGKGNPETNQFITSFNNHSTVFGNRHTSRQTTTNKIIGNPRDKVRIEKMEDLRHCYGLTEEVLVVLVSSELCAHE
jgi:hypothetical protein